MSSKRCGDNDTTALRAPLLLVHSLSPLHARCWRAVLVPALRPPASAHDAGKGCCLRLIRYFSPSREQCGGAAVAGGLQPPRLLPRRPHAARVEVFIVFSGGRCPPLRQATRPLLLVRQQCRSVGTSSFQEATRPDAGVSPRPAPRARKDSSATGRSLCAGTSPQAGTPPAQPRPSRVLVGSGATH